MHLAYVTWSPSSEEWQPCIPERPWWRVVAFEAVESACAVTNHRIICARGWGIRLVCLVYYSSKALTVPITTEQATVLASEFIERVASRGCDL